MNESTYSVLALCDVVIRASVNTERMSRQDGKSVCVPHHHEEWITLRAGEERKGLVFVVGVYPAAAPKVRPILFNGVRIALADDCPDADLPKDFFGLYRLSLDAQ
jgi:hypothetical protein